MKGGERLGEWRLLEIVEEIVCGEEEGKGKGRGK